MQTIFLPVIGLVPAEDMKPGDLVGVNKDSYLILDMLPAEYDSRVKAMEVDEKPEEQYTDIGGLDKQIEEVWKQSLCFWYYVVVSVGCIYLSNLFFLITRRKSANSLFLTSSYCMRPMHFVFSTHAQVDRCTYLVLCIGDAW